MPEPSDPRRDSAARRTPSDVLTAHFIQSFFMGDGASSDGQSGTTLVRALATVAAPALMVAFWIATLAPGTMTPWQGAGVHLLFVLYSFVALGAVATVQWESLFPERMDFLILLPLPLSTRVLLSAKVRAIGFVIALFLVAANVAGTLLLPALMEGKMLRALGTHAVATLAAGLASVLMVLTVESVVVALVPERMFRAAVPLLKVLLIASLLTLLFLYGTWSEQIQTLLATPSVFARCFPPLWYLSLYECTLGGVTATPFAHELARWGLAALPVLALLVVATYPAAWAKRRRMAVEGVRIQRTGGGVALQRILHATVLREPKSRAVFHFILQTLPRVHRYGNYLAIYAGVGLALALSLALRPEMRSGNIHVTFWPAGLQAALPLLLFWMIAGLRGAFLLPVELSARWIFRLSDLPASVAVHTAKRACMLCAAAVVAPCLLTYFIAFRSVSATAVQAVYGVCFAVLLCDVFFFLHGSIPFTRPRLPGRQSLPMTVALYVFGMPGFTLGAVWLEHRMDAAAWTLMIFVASVTLLHVASHYAWRSPRHPVLRDPFLDEAEDDFLTLQLTA